MQSAAGCLSCRVGAFCHRPVPAGVSIGCQQDEAAPPEQGAQSAGGTEKEQLFASLYQELRQLAERQLRHSSGAMLSPTTLLHETYLGLSEREVVFPDRARFMGYAARAMRGLIIDFARERRALKRGGEFHITQLDSQIIDNHADENELSLLSEALDELASRDERLAELVDLKYFCGSLIRGHRGIARRFRTHRAARLGKGAAYPLSRTEERRLTDGQCRIRWRKSDLAT